MEIEAQSSVSVPRLLLSPGRILGFSLLSSGLYVFYWSYLTWKQLRTETRDTHYPVWHALSLFVPIYSWFRFGAHLSVISEAAARARMEGAPGAVALDPSAGVSLLVVSNILGTITNVVEGGRALLVLWSVSVVLSTLVLFLAQKGLNQVWLHQHKGFVRDAPVSWVELLFCGIGLLVWLGFISGA